MKKDFVSLAEARPDLAKEWNYEKNGNLKPEDVSCGSHKKVWWYLSYDVPDDYPVEHLRGKHFDFEWQAGIQERVRGNGCPFLSGKAVWKGFNDLETVRPDLAKQWHPILNKELTPNDVIAGTNKKVWWYLPYDVPVDYPVESLRGKHFDFEWQVSIKERNDKNLGCPFLSGRAVWKGFNDLETVSPELAKQWHQIKNNKLTPQDVTISSKRKVWWYLPYDVPMDYLIEPLRGKHFDFEWKSTIDGRYRYNIGCPFLSGHDVWRGFNDLQTISPELAAQWHPIKNGNLNPTQVTINSSKKVWWYLPYDVPMDYPVESLRGKHFDFEWQATIANRYSGNGCPFLNGRGIWKGFNDLQTVNPELAKQWHLTKNGNLNPTQFTANSHKEIWWFFPYDDIKTRKHFNFEWKATINSRSRGNGCPYLTTYKGEEYIKKYLQKNNISFDVQQKFSDLLGTGKGQLSYDFSIFDEKYGYILIEYNGLQHYESCDFFGGEEQFKKQKEHDKRKRDYAKKHGYKLITVKYTYDTYESIAEYLDKELKKLGVINDTKKEEFINDAA